MTVRNSIWRGRLRMSDRSRLGLRTFRHAKVILDKRGLDASVRYMNNRCLRSAGAAARGIMVKSMRDADDHGLNRKAAKPGRPPLAHKDRGRKLKRLITFQIEGGSDPHTVVIGPTLIRSSSKCSGDHGAWRHRHGVQEHSDQTERPPGAARLTFHGTLTVASDPAAAERQKEHIRDYYKSCGPFRCESLAFGFWLDRLPCRSTKAHSEGVARFWFNQLRAVR